MFNNFLKKIKVSILFIKTNILSYIKLIKFNYLLNIIFLYIIYDCFNHTYLNIYAYIYSFLNSFFYFINFSYSFILFLMFYILISTKSIIFFKIKSFMKFKNNKFLNKIVGLQYNNYVFSNNFNNMFLNYLYYFFNIIALKTVFNYILSWIILFFSWNFKSLYFIKFLINIFSVSVKKINWYPVFKRHSIFGYYRINRQRWVELKSEEVNYIKY